MTFAAEVFFFPVQLFILVCAASLAIADENSQPISVTTHITPDALTLGDVATYTVAVKHDADIRPSAPDIKLANGLEFIEKGESPPRTINGQIVNDYWYKLRVDDVGKLTLSPTTVFFDAPDQKESGKTIRGTIIAAATTVEVQSLLATHGSPDGVRDIKPLEEISAPWIHYFWMALAAFALSGLFIFASRRWKSSRPSRQLSSAAVSALTPEQLIHKELAALRDKGWIRVGRIQDYFFELSEIFRRYLENRYQFPAREWTTEEITDHFKNFPDLSENLKLQARTILMQTDRVKFAKARQAEGRDEMQSVINFVQEACPPAPQQ